MASKEEKLAKARADAEKALEKAIGSQKSAQELRGYPGHKEALKTSADMIHKANKQIRSIDKKIEKG